MPRRRATPARPATPHLPGDSRHRDWFMQHEAYEQQQTQAGQRKLSKTKAKLEESLAKLEEEWATEAQLLRRRQEAQRIESASNITVTMHRQQPQRPTSQRLVKLGKGIARLGRQLRACERPPVHFKIVPDDAPNLYYSFLFTAEPIMLKSMQDKPPLSAHEFVQRLEKAVRDGSAEQARQAQEQTAARALRQQQHQACMQRAEARINEKKEARKALLLLHRPPIPTQGHLCQAVLPDAMHTQCRQAPMGHKTGRGQRFCKAHKRLEDVQHGMVTDEGFDWKKDPIDAHSIPVSLFSLSLSLSLSRSRSLSLSI